MNDNKVMNMAADNIRILAASMVEKAKSGHPGGAMGGADFINTLYSEFLVYDQRTPSGKDATASSSTQATWLPCSTASSASSASIRWRICRTCASGVR